MIPFFLLKDKKLTSPPLSITNENIAPLTEDSYHRHAFDQIIFSIFF